MQSRASDNVCKLPFPLVAIGGSAGSVDALVQFFELMPQNCGIAFIVVAHLVPNEESLLPELLQRRCALQVGRAQDNHPIAANHVHVIPPGRILRLNGVRLQVAPLDLGANRGTVIDTLFSSVAEAELGSLAGVLLSGAGMDGVAGLKRIKQAGGLTLAQEPDEALQAGMPLSAIASGYVDTVAGAAQMPALLLAHFGLDPTLRQDKLPLAQPAVAAMTALDTEFVRKTLASLRRRTGRDCSGFRDNVVLRHALRRVALCGKESNAAYLQWLDLDPAEPEALVRELLVSVTGFFRDPHAFQALSSYIPRLFAHKGPEDFVRVWVPACATGEEAYSIAILLLEHAYTLEYPPGIQVFASDLDLAAIDKARAGLYRSKLAASVGPDRLARFFHREDGGYRVRRELRQIVLFAEHDVIRDPAFTNLDMVSCRNLLIYLSREGQAHMLEVFEGVLNHQGLLFLGQAESLSSFSTDFHALDSKHQIYRREGERENRHLSIGAIQRSLAMEQSSYGRAAQLREARDSYSLNQLQEHLELLRQRLQQAVEHDVSIASANQELQTITQELHATSEELEVNRQELRSMNAELSVVNLELSSKLEELEQANTDLNNLMNAAAIPMVFLNQDLKIMRYTPNALELFRLLPADIGRALSDLRNDLEYPELMADAAQILAGGEVIEREVRSRSGRWHVARILPYYAAQNRIGGVVLTFFDISERRQSEQALQESEQKIRTFISATSDIVYEMSADWQEMRSLVGKDFIATTESPRQSWADEYIPEEERPRVMAAIHQAIETRNTFELEHRVVRLDGSWGWVFSRAIPLFDEQGNIVKWFGAASEVTPP